MTGELKVEVSGEGDFSVETDSAWHVTALAADVEVIVDRGDRDGPTVTVRTAESGWRDVQVWPPEAPA